jgi:hypothetical protein
MRTSSRGDRRRGYSVWLVEWQWMGDHARPAWDPIQAILSPRLSEGRVRWFVEQCYADREYVYGERLRYAVHPERNPYRAVYQGGAIHCGHNPFIFARKVKDFRIGGNGVPTWHEPPAHQRPPLGPRERLEAVLRRFAGR